MKNISKAILEVLKEVTNIEKNMNVGTGNSSYKAVSDSMVRSEVKDSMIKNNLVIVPTDVESKTVLDRWDDNGRSRQSILTESHTKYLLIHTESGESLPMAG